MSANDLDKNREYVEKNREELLKTYADKYIVVVDQTVVAAFDNYPKAVEEAIREFGPEASFLVHHLTRVESVNLVVKAAF